MILATILFCLAGQPVSCPVQHQFRLEARTCASLAGLGARRAQVPSGGVWRDASIRVRCGR